MRRLLLVILLLSAAGCSEPPQKEIDQAQSALDAARAAGADKYAPDEYSAADATIQKARIAVEERDYRQALSYALDARQRALEASRLVPEGRTHAKAGADAALKTANDRATHLAALLHEAEEARVPPRELHDPQGTLTGARVSLQEARKLIDAGNYPDAVASLLKVRENLDGAIAAVASIPPRPRPAKGNKGKKR